MAGRALYLFAIRDGEIDQAIADQLALATKVWADSGLGDRALTAITTGPLSTRRDVEAIAHELRDLTSEDIAVVYITGHGVRSGSGRHYLRLPDTPRGHHLARGYPTADLVTAALASQARQVLVIVNTCFSGELQAELALLYKDLPAERRQALLAVLTSADFDEMPRASEFTVLLEETHRFLAERAGYTEPLLSISEFVRELNAACRRLAQPGTSTLQIRQVLEAGDQDGPSLCLPNPGYQPPLPTIVGKPRRQLATPTRELDYWLDRASGRNSATDPGWYFTGRRELTAQLARFLTDGTGMLVITGAAGTGKSAIIARAVTLSDPDFLATPHYAEAAAAADPHTVPPEGSIDLAVLARNKTTEEITEQLLTAAGISPAHATDASTRMVTLRHQLTDQIDQIDSARPITIVIDGLDEAVAPAHIVTDLIGPLLRHRGVRLVVGVRSSAPGQPGSATEAGLLALLSRFETGLISLRTDGADTIHDMIDYLLARLPGQERLAHLIAESVVPSFLDARFTVHRLLGDQPPTEAELLASLRHGTIGLLRDDLTAASTPQYPASILLAVLRATALAFGAGIPWADIWPAVASAVLNDTVPDSAIAHLMHSRLSGYLTHDTTDGRIVYRPVHEAVADVLRDHPERLANDTADPTRTIHRRIAERLSTLLPHDPGVPPHPYLRRHLVDHAALGDTLTDTTIPATLLPWETGGRVRSSLGLPITPTPETSTLATWSSIEPFLQDTSSEDRALSLDFACTAAGHHKQTIHPPGLRPRWAHWPLPTNVLCDTGSPIDSLCVLTMHDRTLLATGGVDHTVRLWDSVTGHTVGEPLVEQHGGLAVVPLPDGRMLLATGSGDREARLWDPTTGQQVGDPLTGHTRLIMAVAALPLPDGRMLLATGSGDRKARLWDPTTGQQVGDPLTGHTRGVKAVAALPLLDGRTLLATGSWDKTVRLWDPSTGQQVGDRLTGHGRGVLAMAAVPLSDGRTLLATGSEDMTVRLWDPSTGQQVGDPLSGHTGWVKALAAVSLPDGRTLLATGSDDATVRLWDPSAGQQVGDPLTGHTGGVWAVAVVPLPDGRTLIVTGGVDHTVRLWDPTTGQAFVDPLTRHLNEVRAVAAVPLADGRTLLATGSDDTTVRLWDPGTGQTVGHPLSGHAHRVGAVAAVPLPDGRTLLATGSDDATVRLWDPSAGEQVGDPLTGHTGWVKALTAVLLPDGHTLIATSSGDTTVRLWDPTTGQQVGDPLTKHATGLGAVAAVALPNGRTLLATNSDDATVRLWDPSTRQQVGKPIAAHTTGVLAMAAMALPDGRTLLAAGSHDQPVRLWDLETGQQVGDPLTGHTSGVLAMAAIALPDGRALLATGSWDHTVRLWNPVTGDMLATLFTTQQIRSLCAVGGSTSATAFLAIVGSNSIAVIDCLTL
ncbi:AAA family ATPase [Lentzea albida]|uniref:WD40 repeat n=1 Tax=Lentzea albida TaxID=65499 RepID=A0A1H9XBF9_9PSEU|nr:AAA family ATPase [Lentzea albida]SES43510.1 WD40 repeat [Lentzea albida]